MKKLWEKAADLSKIPWIKWGIENEGNAVKDFEIRKGGKVVKCGLFIHRTYPFFAASPDGIYNDCLLEIKCPWVLRETYPDDLDHLDEIPRRNHFREVTERGNIKLKRGHKYFAQCQLQASVFQPII